MSHPSLIGAIEIGTSKTVAIIGQVQNNRSLSIIGIGQSPSQGIKKGEISDFKLASAASHAALHAAEESAGVTLNSIFMSLSGSHLQGIATEAAMNVTSANNTVTANDIERVTNDAKSKQLSQDRVYIHHIKNAFSLDGRVVANPFGMSGKKVAVRYWSVSADLTKVRDQIYLVNGYGIKVDDLIISSIASASMVTTETEKSSGCLAIDIGRGTTDYALYQNGYITRTGSIPVGGDHITNDLALGLRLSTDQAENIKLEFARATEDNTLQDAILVKTESGLGHRSILRSSIYQITHARLQELFSLIKEELVDNVDLSQLPAGAVLTGGTSRLTDIEVLAQQVLGCTVRLGENPDWATDTLRNPEYATSLGLLHYALKSREKNATVNTVKPGLLNKFAKILNLS